MQAVAGVPQRAGFGASANADLRRAAGSTPWGNLTTNPVSALNGATVDRMLADPQVRALCSAALAEAAAVGARPGLARPFARGRGLCPAD